jgi:O-antigen ligase
LLDFSGSGRYQFWQAAVHENATDPWRGTGPGTFEFWWSRHGSYAGFIKNAHSLYLETLGELGIIGLVLIASFVAGTVGLGAVRAVRAPPDLRLGLAAATAGAAAFAVAAGLDWDWQLGVLPAVFMMLAGVIAVAGSPAEALRRHAHRSRSLLQRRLGKGILIGLAAAAMLAIALPLAATQDVASSEQSVSTGKLDQALSDARSASAVQPYAATPHLQQALVLEMAGRFPAALHEARQATSDESTNWRTWLILSRLEARTGHAQAAVRAYRRARVLNPGSVAFAS